MSSRIVVMAAILLLCVNAASMYTGKASPSPRIFVDPAWSTGTPGSDLLVSVNVADITDEQSLYAWEFNLRYDPSVLSLIRTRYFRSDAHTINQHTNRSLLTSQSGSVDSKTRNLTGMQVTYAVGIRVWKCDLGGVESEITAGTPVSTGSQLYNRNSLIEGASWSCPSISLQPTDAIIARVYGKFQAEAIWTLLDTWITDQPSGQDIGAATWKCYYWLQTFYLGGRTFGSLWFDNATCNSRIEISGISKGSFLSNAAESQGYTTLSLSELNNTEGIFNINELINPKSTPDPPYPPIGAVGSGILATFRFNIRTEGTSLLHFDYTELDSVVADELVMMDHIVVDGHFKYPQIRDVAIKKVTAQPNDVIKPTPIEVNVTVENQGDPPETFDVTAYYGSSPITSWTSIAIEPQTNINLTYIWDTTFVSVGEHAIWAEATQVAGETDTADNVYIDGTVTVGNPPEVPTANFTYSPPKPLVTQAITFNASRSITGSGHIVSYTWNFSDGTVETFIKDINLTEITTHAYTQAGTYKIRLTVANNESLTDSVESTVRVIQNPVAVFSFLPDEPIIEESVTFNASVSHDDFDAGNIVTYEWDFGYDGANLNIEGTGEVVTHSYASIGTYTVALKVTDNDGLVDIATDDVTILLHNIAITSIIVSKTDIAIGETITITATAANNGNFSETFQVSFYYNETIIQTKPVNAIGPTNTQTLLISWNTTGVAEGQYIIEAVASTVEGERQHEISDNTKVYGTVTLTAEEQPPPPPTFPSDTIIIIAAAVVITVLALAVYFLRKRKTS